LEASATPSVKSKKVVAKRKGEGYFQSDKIQRDCQGNGETVCISYNRSSDEDTPDRLGCEKCMVKRWIS
jgi:hypothetical protein